MEYELNLLGNQLREVLVRFAEGHPQLPAQILMAAVGEILIQLSVNHVGPMMTIEFLEYLKDTTKKLVSA